MTPAGSVGATIELVSTPPLDAFAIVEDGPGVGMRLIPNVGDGATAAEPALVSGVAAAFGRPEPAPGDRSAEKDQHTIPTIRAHAPAVIPSHKMSPAKLSRRSSTIEAASIGMSTLARLSSVGNTGVLIKFH